MGDVPDNSPAWDACRTQISTTAPNTCFVHEGKNNKRTPFQTTMGAAAGSLLDSERICRLCWVKFQKGASKDTVLEYRAQLYAKLVGTAGKRSIDATAEMPSKRQRVAGA